MVFTALPKGHLSWPESQGVQEGGYNIALHNQSW